MNTIPNKTLTCYLKSTISQHSNSTRQCWDDYCILSHSCFSWEWSWNKAELLPLSQDDYMALPFWPYWYLTLIRLVIFPFWKIRNLGWRDWCTEIFRVESCQCQSSTDKASTPPLPPTFKWTMMDILIIVISFLTFVDHLCVSTMVGDTWERSCNPFNKPIR